MSGWSVLLLAGASGTGKTTVARRIARECGIAWVQVDDLRLALQWSDARLPTSEATEALYFFERAPNLWRLPAERLRDALIATGEAMTEAIAIVTGNHVVQGDPAVIEGDGILPAILEHPDLRGFVASGQVRAAVVAPESEHELLRNMVDRGRGEHLDPASPEARRIARTRWLYSEWLVAEAQRRDIPVLSTQPWESLPARILAAIEPPVIP
jgi:2-phosphoglycerate kinase